MATRSTRLSTLAFVALLTIQLDAQTATEYRPFVEGARWRFDTGFFNDELAKANSDRELTDIHTFLTGTGHDGGVKTMEVKKDGETLTLSERYEYPADEDVPETVKQAAPPNAHSYTVLETGTGAETMNTLSADRGLGEEFIHLLPVQPVSGMEWHWNTTSRAIRFGAVAEDDPAAASFNASGMVKALDRKVFGSSSVDEYVCVEIDITIDGILTRWWWSATRGLVRFGGENFGLSREILAIEVPDSSQPSGTSEKPMDRIVFVRTD